MRRSKKTNGCIRHKLGEDVPDSGQEHLAYSDNGFLVTSASLDAAVAQKDERKQVTCAQQRPECYKASRHKKQTLS